MSSRREGHQRQPITDLPDDLRRLRFPELDQLLVVLDKRGRDLGEASRLREFQARLVRSWSIETGILERLYTVSEAATLTLLEQGFDAALLSHGDTDVAPEHLVEVLRDHQDAAEGLFDFVRGGRALSTAYVKELHQVLTRHQATCDAMDPNGNWVKVPLRRGDWKLDLSPDFQVTAVNDTLFGTPPDSAAQQIAKGFGIEPNFAAAKQRSGIHIPYPPVAIAATNFVVSFHQASRTEDWLGVATAFVQSHSGARAACETPITFTVDRDRAELRRTFSAWLERAITTGLDLWRRSL